MNLYKLHNIKVIVLKEAVLINNKNNIWNNWENPQYLNYPKTRDYKEKEDRMKVRLEEEVNSLYKLQRVKVIIL